jgi:integrase
MPHFPKPFFRESRGLWYIQFGGKQYNLGRGTEEDAVEAAVELKKKLRLEVARHEALVDSEYVETLAVKFVQWCAKNRSPETAECYQARIQSFLDHAKDIRVADLKPYHLDDWCDVHPTWSDGMKRGAMMAVQRCLNWAAKKGYIPFSPIAKVEKPQGGKRDYLITPEEYGRILSLLPSEEFRELVTVTWETGCRPQEVVIVEGRHVDVKYARWIFERENSKGKKRQRVV